MDLFQQDLITNVKPISVQDQCTHQHEQDYRDRIDPVEYAGGTVPDFIAFDFYCHLSPRLWSNHSYAGIVVARIICNQLMNHLSEMIMR